jgi:hypothetical protein
MWTGPASAPAGPVYGRMHAHVRANGAHVHEDGVLSCADMVKTRPRVELHPGVKTGGQGRLDDENGWTDEMDVQTVIFIQKRPL